MYVGFIIIVFVATKLMFKQWQNGCQMSPYKKGSMIDSMDRCPNQKAFSVSRYVNRGEYSK
jgi:hypothetical protein